MFADYGLVQMLQSQILNLIVTAVILFAIWLVGRWLIDQVDIEAGDEDLRPGLKKWLGLIVLAIFIVAVVSLMLSAGSIAMKEIPRTGFDRGTVIEDGSNN